jgi:hypothetical protein
MSLEIKSQYKVPMAGLTFHGNQITYKLLSCMYKDSTIHFKRKHDKYLDLKCIVDPPTAVSQY